LTPVAFDTIWFRNGAQCWKSKTSTWSGNDCLSFHTVISPSLSLIFLQVGVQIMRNLAQFCNEATYLKFETHFGSGSDAPSPPKFDLGHFPNSEN